MRKAWLVAMAAVLFFVCTGMAEAAVQQQKAIQVLLNGEPVSFAVQPTAIDGRTFVEFRSLFAALGYQVSYDNALKKINAVSSDRTIEMAVGADIALVDGKSVPIDNQLRIVNNRTLVGVRFIATLSGKDVKWDAAANTVVIVDNEPTAVFAVVDKLAAAEVKQSLRDTVALFTGDSPIRSSIEESLAEQWDRVQTKTTILNRKIVSYSAQEAVLETVEKNEKTGGEGFSPDYQATFDYTLRADTNGDWRIYSFSVSNYLFTNIPELLNQPADIPKEEEKALRDLLDKQMKAALDEDIDAYMNTMYFDDEATKKLAREQVQKTFQAIDNNTAIGKFVVVDYYGSNKATFIFEATTEVKAAGQTVKARIYMMNAAEKRDGQWLLDPHALAMASEPLE
ncbi:copper amine oxidase N-terminal domain-containing protein [Cohnella sp. AR92]|uniref:copper amine oxidase N-terminal domain-containing protein n=1 Tax=Cohnella sp. AR92 TaxID=648716 RepID=UPI001315413D|nr:copper amine oxidase N-terminal domain-containing protein [Cohnella sp. AR92]